MVQCQICDSKTSHNYVYTECDHFICLLCASTLWDSRYSLKCCSKTTFLQEETCLILQKICKGESLDIKNDCVQNKDDTTFKQNKDPSPIKEDQILQNKQIDESMYLSEREARTVMKHQSNSERKVDTNLVQMQAIVSQSVNTIKFNFQMYKKQLEKRQQILLKSVYDQYSQHLKNICTAVTQQDLKSLKEKLSKTIQEGLSKVTFKQSKIYEQKQDKILQKLQYNQLKMKQKLNRHYQMLK